MFFLCCLLRNDCLPWLAHSLQIVMRLEKVLSYLAAYLMTSISKFYSSFAYSTYVSVIYHSSITLIFISNEIVMKTTHHVFSVVVLCTAFVRSGLYYVF